MFLSECPSDRFSSYTTGDNCIFLFDRRFEDEIQNLVDENGWDWCRAINHLGADIDSIDFAFTVHSTAG